jgi:hypothetical protein
MMSGDHSFRFSIFYGITIRIISLVLFGFEIRNANSKLEYIVVRE